MLSGHVLKSIKNVPTLYITADPRKQSLSECDEHSGEWFTLAGCYTYVLTVVGRGGQNKYKLNYLSHMMSISQYFLTSLPCQMLSALIPLVPTWLQLSNEFRKYSKLYIFNKCSLGPHKKLNSVQWDVWEEIFHAFRLGPLYKLMFIYYIKWYLYRTEWTIALRTDSWKGRERQRCLWARVKQEQKKSSVIGERKWKLSRFKWEQVSVSVSVHSKAYNKLELTGVLL